eukprot:1147065-Pelagomonas_calceolata.AAC.2
MKGRSRFNQLFDPSNGARYGKTDERGCWSSTFKGLVAAQTHRDCRTTRFRGYLAAKIHRNFRLSGLRGSLAAKTHRESRGDAWQERFAFESLSDWRARLNLRALLKNKNVSA